MNVPLEWLSQYVKLPATPVLTDRLTMIGLLLDKSHVAQGDTVIDLELRGNRADLFGLIGIARDVSAAFKTPLKLPPTTKLPRKDTKCPFVTVEKEARGLVDRYTAVKLKVKIKPSPKWMVQRLAAYGLPSINNVVDITNYVMVETGEPMHAFDYNLLAGGRLTLRRSLEGEKFNTIQQGTSVTLTRDDLVITDDEKAQALTMIGGLYSGVNENTDTILLEAAVYNQANCRRTSRRIKIYTDSSLRHEKFLDPNSVQYALERAVYLLRKLASAKVVSLTSDYYPNKTKEKVFVFDNTEVKRLGGIDIPIRESSLILRSLEFKVKKLSNNRLKIVVPSFRTDIEGPADIVEEILRIYGYEKVPATPISDATPVPGTYPSYAIQERLRDHLIQLGLGEVITLTMVPSLAAPGGINLVNPPDPDTGTLRTRLIPSLSGYAQRLLNLNQQRVAIYEIGKVFYKDSDKFGERLALGIALAGKTQEKNWQTQPRDLTLFDLKGILERLQQLLGLDNLPADVRSEDGIFLAEIDVESIIGKVPQFAQLYSVASVYPPVIEDINITPPASISYDRLLQTIKSLSTFISSVTLIDKFQNKLTLRITYHCSHRQLSGKDIEPIRIKLQELSVQK